jgi:hypothetical protein
LLGFSEYNPHRPFRIPENHPSVRLLGCFADFGTSAIHTQVFQQVAQQLYQSMMLKIGKTVTFDIIGGT